MTSELKALIEQARNYRMTPQELESQAISFAYGNGHLSDDRVTKEGVRRAAIDLGIGQGVVSGKD